MAFEHSKPARHRPDIYMEQLFHLPRDSVEKLTTPASTSLPGARVFCSSLDLVWTLPPGVLQEISQHEWWGWLLGALGRRRVPGLCLHQWMSLLRGGGCVCQQVVPPAGHPWLGDQSSVSCGVCGLLIPVLKDSKPPPSSLAVSPSAYSGKARSDLVFGFLLF